MTGGITVFGELVDAVGTPEMTNAGLLLVASVGILMTLTQLALLRRQLKLDALIKILGTEDALRSIIRLASFSACLSASRLSSRCDVPPQPWPDWWPARRAMPERS